MILLDLETEVEMKLPGRFKVSPQIAGAIKAVSTERGRDPCEFALFAFGALIPVLPFFFRRHAPLATLVLAAIPALVLIGLDYHCDGSDLVGLMCLQNGISGGLSAVANSVRIHNDLVVERPPKKIS